MLINVSLSPTLTDFNIRKTPALKSPQRKTIIVHIVNIGMTTIYNDLYAFCMT